MHSDSKGLVLPPSVAPEKVVVVPILFEDSREKVLKKAQEVNKKLEKIEGVVLDSREEYKPGFKFNEWELKGVPLRIEIGPKDVEKDEVVVVRRDTGDKSVVKVKDLVVRVTGLLQENLFSKAEKLLKGSVVKVKDLIELEKAIKKKKIALTPLCNDREVEDELKYKTGGAKVLNILEEQPGDLEKARCVVSGKKADYFALVGKSY
jgi:prolyl-tRNA synthetase